MHRKVGKFLLAIACLTVLITNGYAWVIDGDSVFVEDAQASIRVTPHTAISPTNRFSQKFQVCNKTGTDTTLFAGYIFNNALQYGAVNYWRKPVYGWVEKDYSCQHDFCYILNQDPARQNPHYAWCYFTQDQNGTDVNVVLFKHEFKSGSIQDGYITWDTNILISGNKWQDVTSGFQDNYTVRNGKHIYPYTDGLTMAGNSCEVWEVEYTPNANDATNKWDLWVWAGDNWNCILDDSCDKTLELDPWWDAGSAWAHRKNIKLKTSAFLAGNVLNDHVVLVDFNSSQTGFWGNVKSDGSDVRFVASDDSTVLNFYFQKFDSDDDNMLAWVKVTDTFASANDINFWIYYGNSGASDAQDATNTLNNFEAVYHADESSGTTAEEAKNDFNATASSSSIWDDTNTWLGDGSFGMNYEFYVSQGTLIDTVPGNFSISSWFRPNQNLAPSLPLDQHFFEKSQDSGGGEAIRGRVNKSNGKIETGFSSSGDSNAVYTTTTSWSAGVWHFYTVTWDDTVGVGVVQWVDATERAPDQTQTTLMANHTDGPDFFIGANSSAAQKFDGQIDEFKVYNVALTDDEVKLIYRSEHRDLQEYGSQEPGTPDVEIWQVEGYDLNTGMPSFSYAADANLTITFRASDEQDDDFNFNMWYDTSASGKTNKIIGDINLSTDTSQGSCDTNAKSGMVCTWDFNISGIADNNYWITIEVNDSTDTNTATTAQSFLVDNTAPTVTTVSPIENALGVSADTDITITFSENMDSSTINTATFTVRDTTNSAFVSGTVTFDSDTNTATFNPDANLAYSADHNATITLDVSDVAGNPVGDTNYSWKFETEDYYSISLSQGWNLIAMPTVPDATDPATVLSSAVSDVVSVWTYVSSNDYNNAIDGWLQYDPSAPCSAGVQGCLSEMTAGYGYWMNMSDANTLEGGGNPWAAGNIAPPSRILTFGWNLIGYYGNTGYEVACVFGGKDGQKVDAPAGKEYNATLGIPWLQILEYDGTTPTSLGETTLFEAKKGYWMATRGLTSGLTGYGYIYIPISPLGYVCPE